MAYLIAAIFIGIIGYFVWKNKDQVIALFHKQGNPSLGTTIPNPGTDAKAPTQPTAPAPDWRNSAITQAMTGTPVTNGPIPTGNYDPKSQWRTDLLIDQPGYWKVPAGGAEYTVKAVPGSIVTFLVGPADEGMPNGTVSARGMTQDVINGYGNITFQALDETTPLSVKVDKAALLQRV